MERFTRRLEPELFRLERELTRLRNLPLTEPAPLEDLPETPDPAAARLLAGFDQAIGDEVIADEDR